ncbi:MAG: thioesterase superfamily protein [Proteobacteria bacterium]|nr:thioesterase superfamily protein [Pseudomonadota bacterium]
MILNDLKSVAEDLVQRPGSHAGCMVCGDDSLLGLKFQGGAEGVETRLRASRLWQGYDRILHGGMICSLLDAAMTHCLFRHGVEAMTADLQVRFLKPVPCDTELQLRATLLEQRRNLYRLSAELADDTGILARAEARFIQGVAA